MYSEQGLLELIGPEFLHVCHFWMVSSYCTPGSPQIQVPSEIPPSTSRASTTSTILPSVTVRSPKSCPSEAASMNSSVTDRKSTRLNSSHVASSYAGFCAQKKTPTDASELPAAIRR